LGLTYLVDACQAVGQIPVDVGSLRCDYLAATGRKFLRGPRGVGFLYVADKAISRGDYPLYVDMRGARWTAPDEFTLVDNARRFEDWEFPYALVLGLGAAARYTVGVGVDRAGGRAFGLARRLREQLQQVQGARLLDRGQDPCAIVTVDFAGHDARDLVRKLREHSINTAASLQWYGLIDMTEKQSATALRISPHYYNTVSEIDEVVGALNELVGT
jgi:selenocysteine lyase/cysteine desulfurase